MVRLSDDGARAPSLWERKEKEKKEKTEADASSSFSKGSTHLEFSSGELVPHLKVWRRARSHRRSCDRGGGGRRCVCGEKEEEAEEEEQADVRECCVAAAA